MKSQRHDKDRNNAYSGSHVEKLFVGWWWRRESELCMWSIAKDVIREAKIASYGWEEIGWRK